MHEIFEMKYLRVLNKGDVVKRILQLLILNAAITGLTGCNSSYESASGSEKTAEKLQLKVSLPQCRRTINRNFSDKQQLCSAIYFEMVQNICGRDQLNKIFNDKNCHRTNNLPQDHQHQQWLDEFVYFDQNQKPYILSPQGKKYLEEVPHYIDWNKDAFEDDVLITDHYNNYYTVDKNGIAHIDGGEIQIDLSVLEEDGSSSINHHNTHTSQSPISKNDFEDNYNNPVISRPSRSQVDLPKIKPSVPSAPRTRTEYVVLPDNVPVPTPRPNYKPEQTANENPRNKNTLKLQPEVVKTGSKETETPAVRETRVEPITTEAPPQEPENTDPNKLDYNLVYFNSRSVNYEEKPDIDPAKRIPTLKITTKIDRSSPIYGLKHLNPSSILSLKVDQPSNSGCKTKAYVSSNRDIMIMTLLIAKEELSSENIQACQKFFKSISSRNGLEIKFEKALEMSSQKSITGHFKFKND